MTTPMITTMLVSLTVLTACVYVPPVWDAGDAINDIEWIEPGVTTKEQVFERLGDPGSVVGEQIVYSGASSGGWFSLGARGLIGEKQWVIQIEFDKAGVVRKVVEYGSIEELAYQVDVAAAKKGNPKAQYRLYERGKPETWPWLCRAANNGYPLAQFILGHHYELGKNPFPKDPIEAYTWYTLAQTNGRSYAGVYKDRVVETMTDTQIAEAEILFLEWKPDPGSCEERSSVALD